MITEMKKYTFLVYHREYSQFLEALREVGVVHVTEKSSGIADNEQLQAQLVKAELIRKTIATASQYMPNGAIGSQISNAEIDIETSANELNKLIAERNQLEQDMLGLKKEAERMAIWGQFSKQRLDALVAEGYNLRFFSCAEKKFDPAWETEFNAFVVAKESSIIYFVTVNNADVEIDIDAEEQQLNAHNSEQLKADVDAVNGLLVAKQAQLEGWAVSHLEDLKSAQEKLQLDIDWNKVHLSTTSLADDTLRLLEGFCPVDKTDQLNNLLDNEHIYYTSEQPTEEDETPIKLRNNWFTRMFECLTGMYGWPVYGEFDPTPILGPFFLLFFAMCMGDAGYGIVLTIFGILTTRKVLKIEMFDGLGPLITTLGIATMVIGFFLGTFFGIKITEVLPVLNPVIADGRLNIAGSLYDTQMVLAICIGVFHICLAMTIKAICYTKRFGFKQNISTWGWLLLILGGLIVAILGVTEIFSAEITKWALIVVGGVSALGIYIFNTPGRNPLINIGAGLWDTYNMATGILGDVLSYIRLYALGLAGGMLGAAFNQLGTMVLGDTPNVGTWIGFILILLIGHVLNVCMSALGAFVHPLRLSFVEYFKNAGYEGKGQIYKPFAK